MSFNCQSKASGWKSNMLAWGALFARSHCHLDASILPLPELYGALRLKNYTSTYFKVNRMHITVSCILKEGHHATSSIMVKWINVFFVYDAISLSVSVSGSTLLFKKGFYSPNVQC